MIRTMPACLLWLLLAPVASAAEPLRPSQRTAVERVDALGDELRAGH